MRRIVTYMTVLLVGMAGGGALMYAYAPVKAESGDAAVSTEAPVQVAAQPQIRRTVAGTPSLVGTSTVADLVQKVDAAVVNIDTVARSRAPRDPFYDQFFGGEGNGGSQPEMEEKGVGSGFIVDPNGLIVTNNHVVKGATDITVTMANGKHYPGKVVGTDPGTDLALVRINAKGLPALRFVQNDKSVRVGDWVVAIGSPLGLAHTVSVGIVSALNRGIAINERVNFIQTDAAINPGNSGGALVDGEGRLVGINTAILSRTGGNQGIGFAVPAEQAVASADQIIEQGFVRHPLLGISGIDVSPEIAEEFGLQASRGAVVDAVQEGTGAEEAGVQSGDIIIAVDGEPLATMSQLVAEVRSRAPGDTVELTIVRAGEELTVDVTLSERPR